ncbi:MAG: VWA domain-containing protein [Gammaproteobacteria bacterium]|nr:VWA domain-containing protein [Gammaproteobacteria bacterium]
MEEQVGQLWHRVITRVARSDYPAAMVTLDSVRRPVSVLFRALGGDGGLRVQSASATDYAARRGLLARIAGLGNKVELAWRDDQALRLPDSLAVFPIAQLNRELYFWLAALAAQTAEPDLPWLAYNQSLTESALARYPGLRPRYQRLVTAQLALRPDLRRLPDDEAEQEQAIRAALQKPGSVARLPPARRPPQPVVLWLHPFPPQAETDSARAPQEDAAAETGNSQCNDEQRRRAAERVAAPERDRGLIALRLEALFGWAEHVKVDRGTEDNEDMEEAAREAEDMDMLSVARDQHRTAARIRFDLDLPSAAHDDMPLGPGIALPEWDYRKQTLIKDHCRLQPMLAADAQPLELPPQLKAIARRLRNQFQALAPTRVWRRGQADGTELDIDAWLRFAAERAGGSHTTDPGLYRDLRVGDRDLACLLLADLSLSTDAWINNEQRIIDVIRDSLFLFAESLAGTGDRFAMYGFSSRYREHVRFQHLKAFEENYDARIRGRIGGIRPGFYTRMGAAIRHASTLLAQQPANRRLLLILTDGKPNDLDHYEGRYGIEDTRHAITEARQQGLQPFCVTIDQHAGDYLPHLFGSNGYIVIRKPAELPRQLPLLYMQLTH